MLGNLFWFGIPLGYALIGFGLFLFGLYCGVKISLIMKK